MRRARALAALVLLVIGSHHSLAFAQGKDPSVREAEKHFENGVSLYQEHDFRGALAEFQRAQQLAPNPAVLYNIGQTDYELQDYAGSLAAFESYLADAKPSKERRAEVAQTIEALRSRVATLQISTNVDDSTVLIDDVEMGRTPLGKGVVVSVGKRKITISHDGYVSSNRVVTVAGGDVLHLQIDLDEPKTVIVPGKPVTEPPEDYSSSNVDERKGKTYYFVGARYRGVVMPKFLLNAFIDEGRTIYQNNLGIELDLRKDNFSVVPGLNFAEYGFGDTLFFQKGKDPNDASYWSNINSSLKEVYFSVDFLWSLKVNRYVDFEYGAGFGLGFLFGTLETSWVYSNPNGPYVSPEGKRFSPCVTEGDDPACTRASHQNADVAKVNHYHESLWSGGGSVPNLIPHIYFPELGVRIKPVREIETRVGLGFSLTGFYFGVSGDYGIEKKPEKAADPQSVREEPK